MIKCLWKNDLICSLMYKTTVFVWTVPFPPHSSLTPLSDYNHMDSCVSGHVWLIGCMVFNVVFNSISVMSGRPVHLSMLSWSSFNQYSAQHSSNPLVFPQNHCRNNEQRWERNESCRNDYHKSSERILAEAGIESATSCMLPTELLG